MNRKHTSMLLVAAVTVALLATMSLAQGPQHTLAQEEAGQAALPAPDGLVADSLSYQGLLLDAGGSPVDGSRTFIFRLYLQAIGGTPVWSQTHLNVSVEEGLFHVALSGVDSGLFDGQELWLGVQVQGDAQEMEPRQPLLPAPYALSLRPGAVIRGTVGGLPTLTVAGERTGLRAETVSTELGDLAMEGLNFGPGAGVGGWSSDGSGVVGVSANSVGIYGESNTNTGGFFTSTLGIGLHGNTKSEDPEIAAVWGQNHGLGHGVVGESTEGFGLAGFSANSVGIYGESTTNTGGFFTSTLAIGLHANTSSDDPESAAVVGENRGAGRGVAGYGNNAPGGYFVDQAGGAAVYAAGDVAQDASAAGLVKVGAHFVCGTAGVVSLDRWFNTVTEALTIGATGQVGECTLDLGFDVSQRFWIAMPYEMAATTASCTLSGSSNSTIVCRRWDSAGNPTNGMIMVLVY